MAAVISLYIDENLSPRIAAQLRQRGVDALSVRDLGTLGDTDLNHLVQAAQMRRVLVTTDVDFLRMAAEGMPHAGIIFGVQQEHTLGDWVKALEIISFIYTPDEMENHVEYL